jgi:hypothetical protein
MAGDAQNAGLLGLLSRLCDDELDQGGWERLETLLLDDPAAQDVYRRYVALDVNLAWRAAGRPAVTTCDSPRTIPFPTAALSPPASFGSWKSPFGSFLVSYGVAVVIVGLGMLIGWFCQVHVQDEIGRGGLQLAKDVDDSRHGATVGRIIGLSDCIWSDPRTETFNHVPVPLGRKYALVAGLIEIAYDSGARVILQGPCTYEVKSSVGGYLHVGRMTARVERKGEGEGGRRNSELFSVRTPTAVVTDLGTEFGVEVSRKGATETHVFEGKVRIDGKGAAGDVLERTLLAGGGARLDPQKGLVAVSVPGGAHVRFVRKMPVTRPSAVELIGQLDYSDTWSANSPTRSGSYLLLTTPESLRVERRHGNPPRSWLFSRLSAMTTWPYDDSPVKWPGFQVPGSRSGFTETGIDGTCYLGFEYGLRDDFVVQFDAVQNDDRINITIGDEPAKITAGESLSVFFRAAGTIFPEIGVYTPSKDEADTGIRSGITTTLQWHNYAVRFNLREKRLTIWVDRRCCGTIDLANIKQGMTPGLSWASLPLSAKCVTVGGFSQKERGRLWTDNFRVGSPKLHPSEPTKTK